MTWQRPYNNTLWDIFDCMDDNGVEACKGEKKFLGMAPVASSHALFNHSESDDNMFSIEQGFGLESQEADLMEPVPIACQLCQRVDTVDVFPSDLLRNYNEYCIALQPLTKSISHLQVDTPTRGTPPVTFCSNFIKSSMGNSSESPSLVSLESMPSNAKKGAVHLYDYQLERWIDRYQELFAFFSSRGHTNVSNEYGHNLACWVRRQRHQFKRAKQSRRSTLTSGRVQLLELVGFKWDFHDLAWNENFERLREFYDVHKHCNVPTNLIGDKTASLFNWCKRQKRACRMYLQNNDAVGTRMTPKRLDLLKSIDFRWDPVKKTSSSSSLASL